MFEGTNLDGDSRRYERVLCAAVEKLMADHDADEVRIPLNVLTAPTCEKAVSISRAVDSDELILRVVPLEAVA